MSSSEPPNQGLRPLVPKPASGGGPSQPDPSPAAKRLTYGACGTCRKHKIKCDTRRPECSPCLSRHRKCIYPIEAGSSLSAVLKRSNAQLELQAQQLGERNETLQAFVRALKVLDDADALALLRQFRSGTDIPSLMSRIRVPENSGSAGSPTASSSTLLRSENSAVLDVDDAGSVPRLHGLKRKREHLVSDPEELLELLLTMTDEEGLEVLHRIKGGVSISEVLRQTKDADLVLQLSLVPDTRRRYQLPYRSEFPEYLKTADNPYLNSLIYGVALDLGSRPGQQEAMVEATSAPPTPFVTPFQAAEIVDPYLWDVKASRWTSVTDSDQLVSRLFNAYFLHQYPIILGFHKDYFLEDMAKGRKRFCSSLLVNAVLTAGCHCYRSIPDRANYWSPHNLTYKFLAEAKRLWEMQAGQSSLTAIQAAIVLNTIYLSDTLDRAGGLYMLQAVAMAHDVKLFDSSFHVKGRKMRKARAFTAWSLFIWDSMQAFYYFRPPLITQPPDYPLPDVAADPEFYPDIWVRYPLNNSATPTSFGHVIKATMELRHLTHLIASAFFSGTKPQTVSLEVILDFRARLDNWFNTLPEPLTCREIVLPSHLRLHLEYYGLLLTLVQAQSDPNSAISTDEPPDESAADIIALAYNRIETFIRLYCMCHGNEVYDVFLKVYFVLLGSRAVSLLEEDPSSENAEYYRATLILAVKGLYDQGKNNYLERVVYVVLRNRMSASDKDLLMTYLPADEDTDETSIAQYNQSQYPLPIIKINEDPKTAMLVHLVKEYEKLSLSPATSTSEPSSTP